MLPMSVPVLPETVWLKILSCLEHQDLVTVIELGKQFNWVVGRVAQDRSLWKYVVWNSGK
jgi:hypothetical protein